MGYFGKSARGLRIMFIRQLNPDSPADVRQFSRLPFDLYRNCPQWVPAVAGEVRRIFDRAHNPFYRHSEAAFFVAADAKQSLGRIAIIHNTRYTDYTGRKAAFFYFFDVVDDEAVSSSLFDAAFAWARGRGLDEVVGPKGMLRADGLGLLVEGFEHRAATGIPYNYPYYERLLAGAGFEKEVDYLSGHMQRGEQLAQRFYDAADRIRERRGFTIARFATKADLRSYVPAIGRIYNEAFINVPFYYPVDEGELALIAERLLSVADPKLIKLVMKGDDIAGFVLAYPDVSAALQRTRGQVWPFGWLHLLREFRRTEWLNLNGVGLLPQYQGVGANAILYVELAKSIAEFPQFQHADFAQVAETNLKSLGDVTAIGVHWYKRHRVFRRAL